MKEDMGSISGLILLKAIYSGIASVKKLMNRLSSSCLGRSLVLFAVCYIAGAILGLQLFGQLRTASIPVSLPVAPGGLLCVLQADRSAQLATTVSRTWLSRCNNQLQFGEQVSSGSSVTEKQSAGWSRISRLVQLLALSLQSNNLHWVLIVNENVFAVVENVKRLALSLQGNNNSLYIGHAIYSSDKLVKWNPFSSGVLISRTAVSRLASALLHSPHSFEHINKAEKEEDFMLGQMLHVVGVPVTDARDSLGHVRFLSIPVTDMFDEASRSRYKQFWQNSAFNISQASLCCSRQVVTFGVNKVEEILMVDIALYKLEISPHISNLTSPSSIVTSLFNIDIS